MKKIIFIFIFIFINSCESLIDQPVSNQFGSIKLTFNKPSEELIENINNNRSESQFFDVDEIRITINNSSPETIPIIAGTAFYSKSGISVGNASIKVELRGTGITKYTQTKSVTIIADQTSSVSFNAFAITNQSLSLNSSTESNYDRGDIINLNWSNSHAEQPVSIERWDQVGGNWVKTKIIRNNFIGNSFSWNTQGESPGENVKIRIQSMISNSFVDSEPFQLLSTEVIVTYNPSQQAAFYDVDSDNSIIVAVGSYGSNNQSLIVSFDTDGNILESATSSTSTDNGYTHVVIADGFIFAVSTISSANHIYVDKYDGGLNLLVRNTFDSSSSGSSPLVFGLETYEFNGSTHLVVPIAYDDSIYEYNASMLSYDISGGGINLISNWGYHTTTDDQFAIDVNTRDGDIILTKIYDYTNNPYIYYQRWKNFNPNSGSGNTTNTQIDITEIRSELDTIESYNWAFFNSYAHDSAFDLNNINSGMSTTFRFSAHMASNGTINASENDEWYTSSIFLRDSDYTSVILGDAASGENYFPAIHHYIGSSFQNKQIFTEFGNDGFFIRGTRTSIDSYIAVGMLYDSNRVKDDAILYISNSSNKTSGLLEFSDLVSEKVPQLEIKSSGKIINAN